MKSLPAGVIGIGRTDSVEELAAYYAMADVFVNPTLEDNFPTTNLEALACGTPVVTFETGGSAESIDESPAGSVAATTGWSSAYITPRVLTTSSLAATPETIPTPILQSKPSGLSTGSIDLPI